MCLSTLQMFTLIYGRESKNIKLACQECQKKKGIQVTEDATRVTEERHVRVYVCAS